MHRPTATLTALLVAGTLATVAPAAHATQASPAASARSERLVVHDPRGDVRPADAPDGRDIDARRTAYSVGRSAGATVVRFVVDLPRRLPARDHLQGLVVFMHGGGHDYYVSGNQTPDSVVFADRGPGQDAYVEHRAGTSRTFTRAGRLTLRVPLTSFTGRRVVIDRVYTHLGPLGTGHTPKDHVAPPSRPLRLRVGQPAG
ncbi:MAG: hypothetical protein H6529_09920 [Nocardioides sp.]|nr:hypothetical protein [Nocardioidaceae bacterium]MCB8956782.1 hypothetical protein [Nocardioides sp.]